MQLRGVIIGIKFHVLGAEIYGLGVAKCWEFYYIFKHFKRHPKLREKKKKVRKVKEKEGFREEEV